MCFLVFDFFSSNEPWGGDLPVVSGDHSEGAIWGCPLYHLVAEVRCGNVRALPGLQPEGVAGLLPLGEPEAVVEGGDSGDFFEEEGEGPVGVGEDGHAVLAEKVNCDDHFFFFFFCF